MRQLRKRVDILETKASPAAVREVHIVAVMGDETEEEACARYGKPITEDDMLILIKKPAR